jgi:putative ABC transport system permease protein
MDIRIARGRDLTDRDDAGSPPVGLVTEQLARDLYRTTDAVGRTIVLALPPGPVRPGASRQERPTASFTIVGVVSDMRSSPTATRPDNILFVPLAQQFDLRETVLIVARADDAAGAVATLRREIQRVAPQLALGGANTGDVLLEGPVFVMRVIAALAATLGGLALALAMAGLFGILTHVVERRTREIGIRLAVGAERGQIVRLVLRDGLHPVVKGLVLGLTIGLGSRIVLRGQIVTALAAWDPWEFCALPALFLVAALVACAVPAARASRVDPNVALRDL